MKISLNMLREFVSAPADVKRLASDLTRIGVNVESVREQEDDWILDIEVTSNRPDCLSHLGVAREAAAFYRKALRMPGAHLAESDIRAKDAVGIAIADTDLCRRYCGRVVEGVHVGPSPDWLRRRLEALGVRSINNVADVTNYALMELGHPLHAFDLDCIRQHRIIVRRAKPGEKLGTLDGVDRTLEADQLVIADAERAVALAGIMGGEESEISNSTRRVLLESAWFAPASIRRTAKKLGMRTEASYRFERGADIEMAPVALDRAAALIAELAGGEILRGSLDVYPGKKSRAAIELRETEIRRILGSALLAGKVERLLPALGFRVTRRGKTAWRVTPPSFRPDVSGEVDLVEEVARHYGYDRLPSRLRSAPPSIERDSRRAKESELTAGLVAIGFREIIPPAMVDPEENARFTAQPPVAIENPLSQEASAMRSSAMPSMVAALARNLDRGRHDLAFFEIGKVYTPWPNMPASSGPSAGLASLRHSETLADERRVLALGLTGSTGSAGVHDKPRELGFFDLKGHIETLLGVFDIRPLRFESLAARPYEPNLAGRFLHGNEALAEFGELRQALAAQYKLRQRVWLAEIYLDALMRHPLRPRVFRAFSKFPSAERDFSLLVPEEVTYEHLDQMIQGLARNEIRGYGPVERLPEGKIEKGYYSLLLRVTFQSAERTLTSEEVSDASRELISALAELGVRLRA